MAKANEAALDHAGDLILRSLLALDVVLAHHLTGLRAHLVDGIRFLIQQLAPKVDEPICVLGNEPTDLKAVGSLDSNLTRFTALPDFVNRTYVA